MAAKRLLLELLSEALIKPGDIIDGWQVIAVSSNLNDLARYDQDGSATKAANQPGYKRKLLVALRSLKDANLTKVISQPQSVQEAIKYKTVDDAKADIKGCSNDYLLKLFRIYSRAGSDIPHAVAILKVIDSQMKERDMLKVGKLQFQYYPSKPKKKKTKKIDESVDSWLYEINDLTKDQLSHVTQLLDRGGVSYKTGNDGLNGELLNILQPDKISAPDREFIKIILSRGKAKKIEVQRRVGE